MPTIRRKATANESAICPGEYVDRRFSPVAVGETLVVRFMEYVLSYIFA